MSGPELEFLTPELDGSLRPEDLEHLVRVVDEGGVFAAPAEACYGLSADYRSTEGAGRIVRLKGAASDRPFIAAVADRAQLLDLVAVDPSAVLDRLFEIWPAPATFVLPARGGGTVAVRVPGDPILQRLCRDLGRPLVTTSANPSGMEPARTAEEVRAFWPRGLAAIVDGGPRPTGRPSTLVDLSGSEPLVIRQGVWQLSDDDAAFFSQALWKTRWKPGS